MLFFVYQEPKNLNIFDEDEDESPDCADKMMLRNSHRVDIENILSKVRTCLVCQTKTANR